MYTAAAAAAAAAAMTADALQLSIVEAPGEFGVKPRNDLRSSPTSKKGSGSHPGSRMTAQMTGYWRPRGAVPSIVLTDRPTWPELLRYSRYSQRAHTQ